MPMENPLKKVCCMSLKLKKTCILSSTIPLFLSSLPCMSFWVTVQANYMTSCHKFILPLTINPLLHTTNQMKPGTVSLEKSPQLMNNAKLIVSPCIYPFSKAFKKICSLNIAKSKDGTLSMLLGMIWSWVASRVLSTMMPNTINGSKLISVLLMPFWVYWDKLEESLISRKLKKMESKVLTWLFTEDKY